MRLFAALALCALFSLVGTAQAADAPPDMSDEGAALQLADRTPEVPPDKGAGRRIYIEAAAARMWLRGPAARDDKARGALDLRWDGTLATDLRAVFSDRFDLLHDALLDKHSVNALREAYVSWKVRPDAIVDLGRLNLRNGVAWGFNPTDFFKTDALRAITTPDPASLRENRLGTVLVQGQALWSDGSLSAAYSPRLASKPSDATFSLDLGATNSRNRWLVRASQQLVEGFSPQLLLHGGEGIPLQVGANVSGLLSRSTVGFVEFAGGKGRSLIAQALERVEGDSWRQRAALGLTYTTAFDLSLTAEAEFSSAAPNRRQWDDLRAMGPTSIARFLTATQSSQELPVRSAAFFYAIWHDAFLRRLDVGGFLRQDFVTRSRAQWLETRYHFDRADIALQWQLYSGALDSVYGAVPTKGAVEASLRVFF